MIDTNILSVEKQGRHRYYRFASPDIANIVESFAGLISTHKEFKKIKTPKLNNFTFARTCYDHLAGKAGVKITNSLVEHKIIKIQKKDYEVTEYGKKWFLEIDLNVDAIKTKKRCFAYQCLDWSERKHHIAGALGASLLEKLIEKDWFRKKQNSRELIITSKGKMELKNRLNLEI